MSKDNAVKFMGHSEEMFDKVYSHVEDDIIKEMMKKLHPMDRYIVLD